MLVCQVGQSDSSYVQPQLTEHGPMAIVEGRHPLCEQLMDTEYHANDTYLAGALSIFSPHSELMTLCCTLGSSSLGGSNMRSPVSTAAVPTGS